MQLVRARITWSTHSGITMPVDAVSRVSADNSSPFVADQQDGKTVASISGQLELGPISGNDYTVLSGLKAGDHVVTSGRTEPCRRRPHQDRTIARQPNLNEASLVC